MQPDGPGLRGTPKIFIHR